jgi:hypothetical protein
MPEHTFWSREFDARNLLPEGWQADIRSIAEKFATNRVLHPRSVTSRESADVVGVKVMTVGGRIIRRELPWLHTFYEHEFRALGSLCVQEPVASAQDDRYGVNLNVQLGNEMRYECHVDSNPLEGLLYVTDHSDGRGGELVVANNTEAHSVQEVDSDCTLVIPREGRLLFFDARRHPHYVRPLQDPSAVRIVVAMNYYLPSWPESMRPPDLNRHLFGED